MAPSATTPSFPTMELTREQIEELRADLLAIQHEVERQFVGSEDDSRPVESDAPLGRVSRMDAIQHQQMVEAERRRLDERLRLVRNALQRIEQSDYGFCTRCEEPIGYERLKARPETRVCIRCQEAIEAGG